jgi:hypothetical protein
MARIKPPPLGLWALLLLLFVDMAAPMNLPSDVTFSEIPRVLSLTTKLFVLPPLLLLPTAEPCALV